MSPMACKSIGKKRLWISQTLLNLKVLNCAKLWRTLVLYPQLRTLLVGGTGYTVIYMRT